MNAVDVKVRVVYTRLIRATITLILLAIAQVILRSLPMLEELWVGAISMSGAEIADLVVRLAMAWVVFNLGRGFSQPIGDAWPRLRRLGQVIAGAASLGALLIAYYALLPLAEELLYENMWIYWVVFLVAACFPLYQMGRGVYLSIDDIVAFLTNPSKGVQGEEILRCPQCGQANSPDAKFCIACGGPLTGKVAATVAPEICPQCGAEVQAGAKFCIACGNPLPGKVAATVAPQVCPQCGAEVPAGAKFCSACGAQVTGQSPAASEVQM